MRKRLILAALGATAIASNAMADGFNYSYVQGSVLGSRVKSGGDSDSGQGFRIEGSISNDQPLFMTFSYSRNKYSADSDHLEFTNAAAIVGGHMSLGSNLDLIGGISYDSLKITPHVAYTPRDTNASRSGLGLMAGMRGRFGGKLEWNASLRYRDMEKIDPIIGIALGGSYELTPALSVNVTASHEKYDSSTLDAKESQLAAGVRYQFGTRD
jgi:opacity protein-like surface antigen